MRKKPKPRKSESTGFFKLSHGPFLDPNFISLPSSAKVLYVHLCQLRNLCNHKKPTSDLSFWRWDWQIMEYTGLSRSSLLRGRKQLESAGLIVVTRDIQGNPTYTIIDDILLKEMRLITEEACLSHMFDAHVPTDSKCQNDACIVAAGL